jgi:hypothetical protein
VPAICILYTLQERWQTIKVFVHFIYTLTHLTVRGRCERRSVGWRLTGGRVTISAFMRRLYSLQVTSLALSRIHAATPFPRACSRSSPNSPSSLPLPHFPFPRTVTWAKVLDRGCLLSLIINLSHKLHGSSELRID